MQPASPAVVEQSPARASARGLSTGMWSWAALMLAVVATYAASLSGGFLNYDDPWLIVNNPILRAPAATALPAIWTNLSDPMRMTLGAEFLPVRDTSLWLEVRLFGLSPLALRIGNLLIYLGALGFLRATLLRTLGRNPAPFSRLAAEIAVWIFALHPVHAESVAWLAGRKDVLTLLFVCAALYAHARAARGAVVMVPVLLLLAMLSKGVAVAAPLLLPIVDLLAGRRVKIAPLLLSLLAVSLPFAVQWHVGGIVHMTSAPLGGDRLTALASMGPVFARYLVRSFVPLGLSVAYDIKVAQPSDIVAWLAYLPLLGWFGAGVWLWRRGRRTVLLMGLWFAFTLAPTSQVLVPLQNVEADRYLLLPVLAPCVLLALGVRALFAWRGQAATPRGWTLAIPFVLALLALTATRALVFTDSITLWSDALVKTRTRAVPAYQLGMALDAAGQPTAAISAFAAAIQRNPTAAESASAAGHLARLLLAANQFDNAERVLRAAVAGFPADPKLLNNLAETLARIGKSAEARALYFELVRRFPNYEVGRRNFERRYGPVPVPVRR